MKITITKFSKDIDTYVVKSDNGEEKVVSCRQIVMAMLKGAVFTNASITNKGFRIETSNGNTYVQVNGLDARTRASMHEMASNTHKTVEEKPRGIVRFKAVAPKHDTPMSEDDYWEERYKYEPVVYNGTKYRNDREFCSKFNIDIEKFRRLRAKGYTVEESAGFKYISQQRKAEVHEQRRYIDTKQSQIDREDYLGEVDTGEVLDEDIAETLKNGVIVNKGKIFDTRLNQNRL